MVWKLCFTLIGLLLTGIFLLKNLSAAFTGTTVSVQIIESRFSGETRKNNQFEKTTTTTRNNFQRKISLFGIWRWGGGWGGTGSVCWCCCCLAWALSSFRLSLSFFLLLANTLSHSCTLSLSLSLSRLRSILLKPQSSSFSVEILFLWSFLLFDVELSLNLPPACFCLRKLLTIARLSSAWLRSQTNFLLCHKFSASLRPRRT